MPETDEPVIMNLTFSDEIKLKPIIRQSVQNAINELRKEILKLGGIAPPITAEWSIVVDDVSNPLYSLKLFDYPGEPNPVERRFYHNDLVRHHASLGFELNRALTELLSRRARRQAVAVTSAISGSVRVDSGR